MALQRRSGHTLGECISIIERTIDLTKGDDPVVHHVTQTEQPRVDVAAVRWVDLVLGHSNARGIVLPHLGGAGLLEPKTAKGGAEVDELLPTEASCNELSLS